ncbi:hypothetical protein BDV96DRAFT_272286 [Lophiotrema nucula]|uniref:Box C/D snoRNA protein 1 n=1 Tax=Lophiotrema nucula TaxID=690887 RepID=A0A6A5ZP96_9PLEO|nr:hypothetical protein BDV96DRAFT_272286 [Lophiotrema nucula]
MADDTLLSDLCSICNNARSKYRCPGCSARTCSLPCYKRHQTWAQCTGKRDPAKFVKRSQLATPAGIDHDFNFLTSIERGVEKAERYVDEKELDGTPEVRRGPRKLEVLRKQYADAGVEVVHAPKGLSRHRENKTRRSNKGNFIWTVEWIHQDRSRLLSEVKSDTPVTEAYRHVIGQPSSSKKRKRAELEKAANLSEEGKDASALQDEAHREHRVETKLEEGEPTSLRQSEAADSSRDRARGSGQDIEVADVLRPSPTLAEPDTQSVPPEYRFFLLRPRTGSERQVLVPFQPTLALQDVLRGHTVLEFPSIYIFPNERLPEQFMLEEDYRRGEAQEGKRLEILLESVPIKEDQNEDEDQASAALDSVKVLDVLKQDLGGAL